VRRSVVRPALAVAGIVLAGIGVAACGSREAPLENAGKAASVSLSLTTVPTIRSVTVSPAGASFGNCTGGLASRNTLSTAGKLGFPNGRCYVGLVNAGSGFFFPITITNTGIASAIYVNGSSAIPSDGGNEWNLCTSEGHGGPGCSRDDGKVPGPDQYLLENFSPAGEQKAGISGTPECDSVFDASGRCWAVQGASQSEGIELIGPSFTTDTSTKWTMTITWTPVPSHG
jgi:hypothetical protein